MGITDICARKLKYLREFNNYTQSYVAAQLDISQNAYSLIEKGATKISLDRLEELAHLYKVEPTVLISEEMESIFSNKSSSTSSHNNFPPALSMMEKKMYEQTINRLESNIERLYEMIGQLVAKSPVAAESDSKL